MRARTYVLGLVALLALSSCDAPESTVTAPDDLNAAFEQVDRGQLSQTADVVDAQLLSFMADVNDQLEADGSPYRVEVAEWLGAEAVGRTVLFNHRGNKQFGEHFVPGDARRAWSGPAGGPDDDITWAVDQTGDAVPPFGGLTGAMTTDAITRAMGTWDAQTCSSLPLTQVPDFGLDIGVVAFLNNLGGGQFIFGDVQHAGWGDIDFALGVLGVTFTFVFTNPDGSFTDIDGNGKADVAFREIYYDPTYNWAINDHFDVETIALHEVGHGLSQAHFGKAFITAKNGKVHFSPRALMNATYAGVQQTLLGTDNGGHCSIWDSWPNN